MYFCPTCVSWFYIFYLNPLYHDNYTALVWMLGYAFGTGGLTKEKISPLLIFLTYNFGSTITQLQPCLKMKFGSMNHQGRTYWCDQFDVRRLGVTNSLLRQLDIGTSRRQHDLALKDVIC